MFGQAPATSPFGAPAPAPFGTPAPSAFGQPAATGFGNPAPAPSAFGQPATGFGTAAAPSAFGQPSTFGNPAPAPTGFGGFGAPQPAPTFGQPAPAPGVCLAVPLRRQPFGSPAAAPAFGAKPGGLFGSAPAPAAGGLFGSAPAPAPTGLFGAPAAAPAFGSPAPATPFGAPAPSAFGAAPAPSAFGAPAPSAFGAAPAGGTFGQPAQTQTGSTAVPYQATSKQDGSNSIVLQAITAMPQYEQKSFEELRLEDYMAGNKGTKGQAAPAAAGFGGFGAAPQPASTFGQPAAAPAFGAQPPATGGLFGAAPAPAFGSPAAAPAFGAKPGGLFGSAPAPAPTGLFGSTPAPAPTGLFGAPTAPAPAFGQPAPAPAFGAAPSAFGTTAPAPAFGQPAPAPAFGAAPAPAFGGAPAGGGLFGSTAPAPATGGLFGSTPAAAPAGGLFGAPAAPAAGGSLFGAPAPASGGLFGQPPAQAPAGGLFGAPAPAPAGGLFGAPSPAKPGGLFGQPAAAPAPATGLFGATPATTVPAAPPPSAEAVLAQQLAAVENQKKQLELLEAWRGNPPSGSKVVPTSQYDTDSGSNWNGGGGSYAASSSALVSYQAAPRSAAKIRPRGYTPSRQSPMTSLTKKTGSPILSPNRFVGSATKTLFIKPNSMTPKPKTRLLLTNGVNGNSPAMENGAVVPTQQLTSPSPTNGSQPKPVDSASPTEGAAGSPTSPAHDFYRQVVDPTGASPSAASPSPADNKFVPKLTKAGYNVSPSISVLEAMSEADLAAVSNFQVERPGYGSVKWDGAVDVRGVDIDTVVVIESKNVSVYDEAEENGEKPPQGSKLNRPAVITMQGIFPKDGAESSADAKTKLKRKIEKSTKKMGAELLSFEEDVGVWKFRVGHFSRYGLDDDDSDEESDAEIKATPSLATDDENESPNPVEQMKELGGASTMRAPLDEDDTASAYSDNMSAVETMDPSETEEDIVHEIVQAGEEAYAMMTEEVLDVREEEALVPYEPLEEVEEEKILFPNEGQDYAGAVAKPPLRPTMPITRPATAAGICNRLAAKSGLKSTTSSSIDFGMRMRRSFRVGWRPDGSFVKLQPSSSGGQVLVQSKPVIAPASDSSPSLPLLQTHHKHSVKAMASEDDAPIYTLPRSAALFSALDDYSKYTTVCSFNGETKRIVSSSFSLLTCLYGGDGAATGTMSESRRLEAVSSWMKEVCSPDTAQAISSEQSSGDVYGSIFAALSGGDVSTASSLALESGNPRLSLMLANSGVQAEPFCRSQLAAWNQGGAQQFAPTGILRTFSLAGGSIDLERQMYKSDSASYCVDWRRRFGMLLWSCSSSDATVSSIVKQYGQDLSAGTAPPATPLYCGTAAEATNQCLLYQLLNHYAGADSAPVTDLVSPSSHSPFHRDFSASFHLVAAMTALSKASFSAHEEDLIVDAVAAQLIQGGAWEWAVYASLCFIGSETVSESMAAAKRLRAKNIIARFHSPSDPSVERHSSFLQSIGIPTAWLRDAQACHCASAGDPSGFAQNLLLGGSVSDAMTAMEQLVIPHMLLEGKESMEKLWHLLEAIRVKITEDSIDRWNQTNGCRVIHQYLELHRQVDELSNLSQEQVEAGDVDLDHLLALTSDLETEISDGKSASHESSVMAAKIPPTFTTMPWDVLLAEMAATLALLRLKLLAIKDGQPVGDMDRDSSSRLAFSLVPGCLFDSAASPSILRGFCGHKATMA